MSAATKRDEGYLLIDHRNSPGVSAELVRASGFGGPVVGAGKVFEAKVKSCVHCGNGFIVNPDRTRERGYCAPCDGYLCDSCAVLVKIGVEHKPFQQILDHAYARAVNGKVV